MSGKKTLVKSASRVLDIIEYIVNSAKPPTFKAIQESLDIPKSSLSYLLQDLITREYIYCDIDTKVYYPGLKLIQVGAACINNTDITKEIGLVTKQLSDELGETTHAGILEGRFVVYIAKCHGEKELSAVRTIGFKIPAHATGVGKVLLAALPESEVKKRLAGVELERYTQNTIVSEASLLNELRKVADQGFAIDDQEIIPGGICVAAPIHDKEHRTIAALSVTIPAIRIAKETMNTVIEKVQAAAKTASGRLGRI
ncbi:IclR family transcriptional regulator [Anaerospora sp.]|jgi:DNA-binding IclR family transcriptional regulator|uniref:IclR family transcriptional regulator n=1 Tax=Anaerospora sp. TaxID=1960278 RepID=UPI002899FEA7|nr:IclR family transcriptional regulator [Anaerospora sp.]MDF2929638.1 allR [Anaerospora sp.]